MPEHYDVFISHASEDKESFVRPLAQALRQLGVKVWFDEFSLDLGDSISREIDKGIAGASFGIVVISPAFIGRNWPEHELRGLIQRDVGEDLRILPIWHGVSHREVARFSPSLADKIALDTRQFDATEAAIRILRLVRPDLYGQHPRAELERLASGEAIPHLQREIDDLREQIADYQCPYCGAALSSRIPAPADPEEKHWDEREIFECGYTTFDGVVERPCPKDPRFPKYDEYELRCQPGDGSRLGFEWECNAFAKTEMARRVHLQTMYGKTEEEVRRKMYATYLYEAAQISNHKWNEILFGTG